MTFEEDCIQRRQRYSSFWTAEEVVFGKLGPFLGTTDHRHACDSHFSVLDSFHPTALQEAAEKLEKDWNQVVSLPIADFEELYRRVEQSIGSVNGIGALAVYDISLRIGCSLRPVIIPQKYVYTHGNEVEKAAVALLPDEDFKDHRIEAVKFKSILPCYSAMEIEHALCVYSEEITKNKALDLNWLKEVKRP
jgi:hypothetical protein